MSEWYGFVLGALCTWRVTHLLHAEDGPWDLLKSLRRRARGSFWSGLLDCFYCLSLWIAAPLAFLLGRSEAESWWLWPGLSAAACLLERATGGGAAGPATYWEDEENDDVLRTIERGSLPETPRAPNER